MVCGEANDPFERIGMKTVTNPNVSGVCERHTGRQSLARWNAINLPWRLNGAEFPTLPRSRFLASAEFAGLSVLGIQPNL
jgi:hypothetical protein